MKKPGTSPGIFIAQVSELRVACSAAQRTFIKSRADFDVNPNLY